MYFAKKFLENTKKELPEEDAKATSFSHYVKVTVPKQENFLTRLCCQICFFSSKWLPCQWNTTIKPENRFHQRRECKQVVQLFNFVVDDRKNKREL